MTAELGTSDGPPAELRFRRKVRLSQEFRDLWRSRDLVRTLAARDLRARYKQAILGFGWAVIPPVGLLLVFSVFVQRVGKIDTQGVPYQLYAYLGLISWTFFSSAVSTGGLSLVTNMALLNRVYFPREVFPLASIAVAGVDAAIASLVLLLLFPLEGFAPKATSLWVPLLLLIQMVLTVGVVLIISSVVVYLRDIRHALPILLQLGLFATPVAYSLQAIPAHLRLLYSIANPLAPIMDGYRRAMLLGKGPDWGLLLPATAISIGLLALGYVLFKRLETGIADVA